MAIIGNGARYVESKFPAEKDFEDDVVNASKMLFGKSTVYINAKRKIESKSLGGTVPDGFFFDFSDSTDPQFYIVEVELSRHRFYEHIFPQITKFFAFFKNTKQQKTLVDKLFSIVNTDDALRGEFKKYLGQTEIYKFLSDIVESSQNILLIADGAIPELPEIMDTYTDTWGKMVRYLEIKKYISGGDTIYSITPDFETLQYTETPSEEIEDEEAETERPKYSEEYHLDGVSTLSKEIYGRIKAIASRLDDSLVFNPQKYYVSIKANKNIAFIKVRNKKVRFIVMMPESEIRKCVSHYPVASLSAPVQQFYNGPCAAVDISNLDSIDELEVLIRRMIEYNQAN
jgi:predicted transport protein